MIGISLFLLKPKGFKLYSVCVFFMSPYSFPEAIILLDGMKKKLCVFDFVCLLSVLSEACIMEVPLCAQERLISRDLQLCVKMS